MARPMVQESRRQLNRAVTELARREADLLAGWRAGDPLAEALAGFCRRNRERAELELARRGEAEGPESGDLFGGDGVSS